MKLFPRHRKILVTIKRQGKICDNLLYQMCTVSNIEEPCKELKREGLICWVRTYRGCPGIAGWKLTKKGIKLTKEWVWYSPSTYMK